METGGFIPKDPKKEKHQIKKILKQVFVPENKLFRMKLAQHINQADAQQVEAVNEHPT